MAHVKGTRYTINEGCKELGALKSVLNNRGLKLNAKKCLYEGVIVPKALYGAEACCMNSAERRKVYFLKEVFEMFFGSVTHVLI